MRGARSIGRAGAVAAAGESKGSDVRGLDASASARFGAFWAGWDGGGCGGLVWRGSAPHSDPDIAGACFRRFVDVMSEMRIGTELEGDATAPDLADLRGEFVCAVRVVGVGLGLRGVELAGAAAPGFRAFERRCTGPGRDAGLGLNTTTDAGMAVRVARVFGRLDGLFGAAD